MLAAIFEGGDAVKDSDDEPPPGRRGQRGRLQREGRATTGTSSSRPQQQKDKTGRDGRPRRLGVVEPRRQPAAVRPRAGLDEPVRRDLHDVRQHREVAVSRPRARTSRRRTRSRDISLVKELAPRGGADHAADLAEVRPDAGQEAGRAGRQPQELEHQVRLPARRRSRGAAEDDAQEAAQRPRDRRAARPSRSTATPTTGQRRQQHEALARTARSRSRRGSRRRRRRTSPRAAIKVFAHGQTEPDRAELARAEGMAKNRRVEIVLGATRSTEQ